MGLRFFTRKSAADGGTATAPRGGTTTAPKAMPKAGTKAGRNRALGPAKAAVVSFEPAQRAVVDTDVLRRMLQQHRYRAILNERERWRAHPEAEVVFAAAAEALEREMALVPAGSVTLALTLNEGGGRLEQEVEIAPYLLSIHPVTNERYQAFVDAGGYDDLEFWPSDIWPHLIEFVDQTRVAGPRYWRDGRHDRRLADHPVVGVSWYEACAYGRWVGLRLPTEAEWQMAASWRIRSEADVLRRFPWGDAMDRTRCNIWGTMLGETVPVDAFESGAAPNNVLQLIGNVWEWTGSEFEIRDDQERPIFGEMPMKSIRGAAFDTYFEAQASSGFRTGQIGLGRAHNVGFRCAGNAK